MTFKLLLSKSLDNLRIFEFVANCPYLLVDTFTDSNSVDSFFFY